MSNAFIITMAIIALVFGVFPMARFLYTNFIPYLKDSFSQDAVLKMVWLRMLKLLIQFKQVVGMVINLFINLRSGLKQKKMTLLNQQ